MKSTFEPVKAFPSDSIPTKSFVILRYAYFEPHSICCLEDSNSKVIYKILISEL